MDSEEFNKYVNDKGDGKDGLLKVAVQSVVENVVPVIGGVITKVANGIQDQIDEKKMKGAFEYLEETKVSKDDMSVENIVKIIRNSQPKDWDYEELQWKENYPKHIANLNYRLNMDISIKVIENHECKERHNWMPVTFIDDDFKWYNTAFIFSCKNREFVNDSVSCYNLDGTFIPFEYNGKISREDYDFAKLLNEVACGRDEQYLWFYTHQKGQNIVEDDYGTMDDITLYRFLKTQCDGEMINWDDNIPHFETLSGQAKEYLALYK